VTAAVSVVVAIVLAATSIVAADDHGALVALLAVGAVVALTVALVAEAPVVVWVAVVMLGAAGALADAPAPPLFAVGLFAVAEGAYWSFEERFARVEDRGVHRDRLVLLGAIAAASLFLGAAMRLLARDEASRGSGYTVVAAACIVALVLLVVARARFVQRSATRS
jgi:hypothetical protein